MRPPSWDRPGLPGTRPLAYAAKRTISDINAYLRAVEKALAEVPAGRRRELLANLSERVAARRVELRRAAEPARRAEVREEGELSDLLELFGDEDRGDGPHERDPSHPDGAEHAAAPLVPEDEPAPPSARRIGALAWVLVVAASMLVMCVAAALTFVFLLVRANLD